MVLKDFTCSWSLLWLLYPRQPSHSPCPRGWTFGIAWKQLHMSKLLVMNMIRWEVLKVSNFVTWPCSNPCGLQGPWPSPSWHRWSWRQASRYRPQRRSCRQPWWPPGAKERVVKLFILRCKNIPGEQRGASGRQGSFLAFYGPRCLAEKLSR